MKQITDIESMTPNQLVSWFLISGYAYYVLGDRVMTDPAFDHLVERLKVDLVKADHMHKHLITESHLEAVTGYDINYPKIAQYSAMNYLRELR